jgi:hypothetical protein
VVAKARLGSPGNPDAPAFTKGSEGLLWRRIVLDYNTIVI